MSDDRIPVHLLTGFLGSGKSTLLAAAVREPGMDRTAVIVNEFGEVGLDHLLVTAGGEDTVLLDSGCLCCLGSNQIQDTLMVLLARRKRGEIIAFDRVLIETSGLADPAPLLQPLLADAVVSRRFALGRIATVLDAAFGAGQLASHPEARKQIAVADRIILSKCDVANPAEAAAATTAARALNADAPLLRSRLGINQASELLGIAGSVSPRATDPDWADHGHHDHAHAHSHGVSSRVIRLAGPLGWEAYAAWLAALRRLDGSRLLRTKGIADFGGALKVIQGVQHVFAAPADYSGPAVAPFIVMITQGLDPAALDACCAMLPEA